MIQQRQYGTYDWTLSEICFGSMRMVDSGETSGLLERLFDLGVDTHHSSDEYDAHPHYLERLASARGGDRQFKHIVKLANPHFGENAFDPTQFEAAVDRSLAELGAETLHNVQWLVRSQPIDDPQRLATLAQDCDVIASSFGKLKASGKVQSFSSFPYSTGFATEVLRVNGLDGLTTYLNLIETQYAPWATPQHPLIAIRPLAAGKLKQSYIDELSPKTRTAFATFTENTKVSESPDSLMKSALRFPLLHPDVVSVIVSARNIAQAEQLAILAEGVSPNLQSFLSVKRAAAELPEFADI